MDKKYQVFVSSTYIDLTDERKEVIQTLFKLDAIPVGMSILHHFTILRPSLIIPMFFLSLFATNIQAQNIVHLLEGGALAGAEIARNTGDFKYAPNLRYTLLYQVHPRLQIGSGIAYETFKKENLTPVYADIHAYTREAVNSPFFAAQIGYAFGWHKDYQQLEQYEYCGGWMLGFDYGRRLPINEQLAFYVALGLQFQTIHVEVDVNYLEEYVEQVNYVLLALKMGIAF